MGQKDNSLTISEGLADFFFLITGFYLRLFHIKISFFPEWQYRQSQFARIQNLRFTTTHYTGRTLIQPFKVMTGVPLMQQIQALKTKS